MRWRRARLQVRVVRADAAARRHRATSIPGNCHTVRLSFDRFDPRVMDSTRTAAASDAANCKPAPRGRGSLTARRRVDDDEK